ncbi:MAG: hypothetical protein RIT81_34285 [Deltaproteobacteria bacterium]
MAFPLIAKLAVGAVGLFTGANMIGKLFGSDPDFTQAWMMNRMTGRGGFLKTYFGDGLGKLFLGSRTMSAMYNGGFGAAMFMNPMAMGGYGMNPMMMGAMPYNPMMMGSMMWGAF